MAEAAELLVGAYLKMVERCDVVGYNIRPPGGDGGLHEIDVVGFRFSTRTAFLCEVATSVSGLASGKSANEAFEQLKCKVGLLWNYTNHTLNDFAEKKLMLWAPNVPNGPLLTKIKTLNDIEFVVNEAFTQRIQELRCVARDISSDEGNTAFRILQILEHLH